MTTRRELIGLPITEAQLQKAVIQLARQFGFRVAHFRKTNTPTGWRTPVAADGAGFPDVVMVGNRRVLFVEFKQNARYPKPEQRLWLDGLRESGQEVYVWKPSQWESGEIERTLKEKP